MYLTIDEALKQVSVPPDALLKGVKSGRLSGFLTSGGDWLIDAKDLLAKYETSLVAHDEPVLRVVVEKGSEKAQIAQLRAELEAERQRSADLRLERDRWAAQAEKVISLMLPQVIARAGA